MSRHPRTKPKASIKPRGTHAKGEARAKPKPPKDLSRLRGERALTEYRFGAAMAKFRLQQPHLWLQAQRLGKLLEIQQQVAGEAFPPGCCFLHANVVSISHFCVKQVREVNLDTAQVTMEIHADDNLEAGIVIIPLETIEWFGFPAKAVPVGVHFEGFTGGAIATAPRPAASPPEPPPPTA